MSDAGNLAMPETTRAAQVERLLSETRARVGKAGTIGLLACLLSQRDDLVKSQGAEIAYLRRGLHSADEYMTEAVRTMNSRLMTQAHAIIRATLTAPEEPEKNLDPSESPPPAG